MCVCMYRPVGIVMSMCNGMSIKGKGGKIENVERVKPDGDVRKSCSVPVLQRSSVPAFPG